MDIVEVKVSVCSSHHPQTIGQTKVANRSLGYLLRSLIDSPKQGDLTLPQAKFAYNRSINCTMGKSPFGIVYGRNPTTRLDLAPLAIFYQFSVEGDEQSSQIKDIHQQC